ncbi:MAG: dienelactone hydrolase family protein [Myxococcaceae bacterium]
MPGTKLEIKTADGVADAWAFHPKSGGKALPVIMFPDALGVRAALKDMAEHLSGQGFFVLLPNIFYRMGDFAPFDAKTAFSNPSERERVMKIARSLDAESAKKDTQAYLDAIAAQPHLGASKVGTMGYCMGGRLAYMAAANFPDRVGAAAGFHAGHLVTDQPDSPHLLADKVKARLYFGVADNDQGCTPEMQGKLAAAFGAAHLAYQIELYPHAMHGFAVTDTPVFSKAAQDQHWDRAISLFRAGLQ